MSYHIQQKKIHSLNLVNQIVLVQGTYYSIKDLDIFFEKNWCLLKKLWIYWTSQSLQVFKTQNDLIRMIELLKKGNSWKYFVQSAGINCYECVELLQHLCKNNYPQNNYYENNVNVAWETILNGSKKSFERIK